MITPPLTSIRIHGIMMTGIKIGDSAVPKFADMTDAKKDAAALALAAEILALCSGHTIRPSKDHPIQKLVRISPPYYRENFTRISRWMAQYNESGRDHKTHPHPIPLEFSQLAPLFRKHFGKAEVD